MLLAAAGELLTEMLANESLDDVLQLGVLAECALHVAHSLDYIGE